MNSKKIIIGVTIGIIAAILWSVVFINVLNSMAGIGIGICLGISFGISGSLIFSKKDEVYSELLPADKVEKVEELIQIKSEKENMICVFQYNSEASCC